MVNLIYSLWRLKGIGNKSRPQTSRINPVHKRLLSGDYKYPQYVM